MKKHNHNLLNDAELWECFNSVYYDLQFLLKQTFTNVNNIPKQLTVSEFISLFEKYDWNDIFNKLEELENATELSQVESVYSFLLESLKSDIDIQSLKNSRENTYYKVWAGLMTDEDF